MVNKNADFCPPPGPPDLHREMCTTYLRKDWKKLLMMLGRCSSSGSMTGYVRRLVGAELFRQGLIDERGHPIPGARPRLPTLDPPAVDLLVPPPSQAPPAQVDLTAAVDDEGDR